MGSTGWSTMFRYTDSEVKRHAPISSGVYRLIRDEGGKRYVFYVGESKNLEERLLSHLGSSEHNTCIRRQLQTHTCYFDFVSASPESERRRLEMDTIRQFTPTCNA